MAKTYTEAERQAIAAQYALEVAERERQHEEQQRADNAARLTEQIAAHARLYGISLEEAETQVRQVNADHSTAVLRTQRAIAEANTPGALARQQADRDAADARYRWSLQYDEDQG
jgi:hypothetical protein